MSLAKAEICNIALALKETATATPQNTALIVPGKFGGQWTFKQIEENSRFYADFLQKQGVRRGERVMLMVKPSMPFICLTFALFSMGAVVILIDPGMGYKNLLRCISSVEPETLIGIPKAQLFKRIFAKSFPSVRRHICVGQAFGLLGKQLPNPARRSVNFAIASTLPDDLAAIIFTTGSTGPPKGVQYEHRIFQSQLAQIKNYYGIKPGDVDQPAFPLFALFSIALGACAVIPAMDASRPAQVDPRKFIRTIEKYGVNYSFGSPAIWQVVGNYCQEHGLKLPTLKKVLMAGAPVSGDLLKTMFTVLPDDSEIHIPYGATESLPVISMSGREVVADTWELTRQGKGACVGRPLPGVMVRIIKAVDQPVADATKELPVYEIGEIIVKGEVVTRSYFNNEAENRLAKIPDGSGFWHRIGDVGYFDKEGRLWFCGRKAHRVITATGILYTICCEAIFNQHSKVRRSALVGIGESGHQQPVLIVELYEKCSDPVRLMAELRKMALQYPHTAVIEKFMIHDSFPVDIRHNAKIFREKLARWVFRRQETGDRRQETGDRGQGTGDR